jgi:O-antigen ligase
MSPPTLTARWPATFIATLFALAAVGGPLLLGSTWPWPRCGLELVMAVAAIVWALACRPSPWRMMLPLAAAAVALLQVVPLPDGLLMRLSPISGGAWKVAHAGGPPAWGSIAIDPGTALTGTRRLLLGLATILVTADVARDRRCRGIIGSGMATAAVCMMILAAAFPTTNDDRVALGFIDLSGPIWFWKTPVDPPVQTAGFSETDWVVVGDQRYVSDSWIVGDRIGAYIVSNHYAGGVCLTLPLLLGGMLSLPRSRRGTILASIAAVAVAAGGLWTVAVVAKSRAGTAALIVGLTTLVWLVSRPPRLRLALGIIAAILATVVVAGALALHGPLHGIDTWFPERFRPMVVSLLTDGRVLASQLAGRMFAAAPVFGTGLGSYYELAGRMLTGKPPWGFAHNDYAQWLAETGLIGGLLAAVAGAALLRIGTRFAAQRPAPHTMWAAGAWAALAGIAAHSFFDWNLHVPANAFLATVAAGLALSSTGGGPAAAGGRSLARGMIAGIFIAAIVGSAGLLVRDASSATVERQLRAALAEARLSTADRKRPSAEPALAAALDIGRQAARWDPANARLWLLLGQLELHLESREAAAEFFARARRASAVVRGLPEPVPPAPPKKAARKPG